MLWAGAVTIAKLLKRRSTAKPETNGSYTSETTRTYETQEVSFVQRENSRSDSNLSLREWTSVKSPVTNSTFSEAMSDKVTVEQQRKEESNAIALIRDTSPVSEELLRTGQWIQDTRSRLRSSPEIGWFWLNSNNTTVKVTPQREGFSRAPNEGSSPGSKDTDVGCMDCAKYGLEASLTKAFGKQKKVLQPPPPPPPDIVHAERIGP